MPWTTKFEADQAELHYTGDVTGEDILRAKKEFFADPKSRSVPFVLCDFTDVKKLDVRVADVQRILHQDLDMVASHPRLVEVVVAPQAHAFGLARMWEQQVHDERRTKVVHQRAEADLWIRSQGVT